MKEIKGLFNRHIGNRNSVKNWDLSDKKSNENIPSKGNSKYTCPEWEITWHFLRKRKKPLHLNLSEWHGQWYAMWSDRQAGAMGFSFFPRSSRKSLEGFKHRSMCSVTLATAWKWIAVGAKMEAGSLASDISHPGKRLQQRGLGWWPSIWRKWMDLDIFWK